MTLRPAECVNLAGTDTGGRDCLSHTRLNTLLACEQRYKWQYVERLDPAVKPVALSMGAAFAEALEHNDPQTGYNLVLEEQAALSIEHGGNPWLVIPTEDEARKTATIVRAAARGYLKHYGHQGVRREVTLRQRLRNPDTGAVSRTFDVQARIDGLAGTVLVEDKFMGRVDLVTEQRLRLDRQVTLGAYLLWRCEGIDVTEVSYRVSKKPSIRQTQKETLDDYLTRVEQDYEGRPEFYFHEFRLQRTHEDFERLEHEMWQWADRIRAARRADVWPRNTSSCAEFSGCRYLGLCAREPGAEHQFTVREAQEKAA